MPHTPGALTRRIHGELIAAGKMKPAIPSKRDQLLPAAPEPARPGLAKAGGPLANAPWKGELAKKPWHYRVTAVIAHRNTPEHLELCLQFLTQQSERPYVTIIDTGSNDESFARVLALRSEAVEVHRIACHATEEYADAVCYAMDLAMSACRTEYLWCLYSDCFIINSNMLAELLAKADGGRQPVIGYESISANQHPECKGMVSDACTLLHMPTMRRLEVTWSRAGLAERAQAAGQTVVFASEMSLNYRLRERGVEPLILGREQASGIERDDNRVLLRSEMLTAEMLAAQRGGGTGKDRVMEEPRAMARKAAQMRQRPSESSASRKSNCVPATVAVIVPCHNYARFLDECLMSIVTQSRRPDEILVVDDASDDDTRQIASRWESCGVQYIRTEHRNVRLARLSGLNATRGDVVCFVDADDRIGDDYLRDGLQMFDRYDVGLVHSDMHIFGEDTSIFVVPDTLSVELEARENYAHCGVLFRRESLLMSGALTVQIDPTKAHEDWYVCRRILQQGWGSRKQPAAYYYRRHGKNATVRKQKERPYFDLFGMEHETVTVFISLSGRTHFWPKFERFFQVQSWPHGQVRLMLMDTSQDEHFGGLVRSWLASCDYRDTRYFAETVAAAGLADLDRRDPSIADAVRFAAARIYNRLAREATGNFVLTIEDDVLPPPHVIEALLRAFDHETASVAAPYLSRFHDGYVAWRDGRTIIEQRGSGIEAIEGNGFGCTMLRAEALRSAVFTAVQPPYVDFDPAFYQRLKRTGLKAKVRWDVECQHLEKGHRHV